MAPAGPLPGPAGRAAHRGDAARRLPLASRPATEVAPILITGATGTLGRAFAPHLRRAQPGLPPARPPGDGHRRPGLGGPRRSRAASRGRSSTPAATCASTRPSPTSSAACARTRSARRCSPRLRRGRHPPAHLLQRPGVRRARAIALRRERPTRAAQRLRPQQGRGRARVLALARRRWSCAPAPSSAPGTSTTSSPRRSPRLAQATAFAARGRCPDLADLRARPGQRLPRPADRRRGGIWHLANDGDVSWAELAERAASLAGVDATTLRGQPGKPARRAGAAPPLRRARQRARAPDADSRRCPGALLRRAGEHRRRRRRAERRVGDARRRRAARSLLMRVSPFPSKPPMPHLIVFSHLRWEFVFQRPQHLLSRLARHYPVVFVEEPVHANGAGPSRAPTAVPRRRGAAPAHRGRRAGVPRRPAVGAATADRELSRGQRHRRLPGLVLHADGAAAAGRPRAARRRLRLHGRARRRSRTRRARCASARPRC